MRKQAVYQTNSFSRSNHKPQRLHRNLWQKQHMKVKLQQLTEQKSHISLWKNNFDREANLFQSNNVMDLNMRMPKEKSQMEKNRLQ